MSEKDSKASSGNIDLTKNFVVAMTSLCLSEDFSDIVLIVENQKLPAHKNILASQSEYFRALLAGRLSEPQQKEIELKEVPLEAFKILLRYVYSGCMPLFEIDMEIILEILRLTDLYGFTDLRLAIVEYLKEIISVENIYSTYERIRLYTSLQHFKEFCLTFMDRNASHVVKHKTFIQFSKESLQEILCRDTFLTSEFEIFIAVCEWCKQNPNVNSDSILALVRLTLIDFDEHLKDVQNCKMLGSEKLLEAIVEKNSSKKLPYRVWREENMATKAWGSKIIKGAYRDSPLDNISSYDLGANQESVCIIGVNGKIVVQLGVRSVINHIKILLHPDNDPYSYFIEVSENQSRWDLVVDCDDFHCKNWQSLYFPPTFTKYIKMVTNGQNPIKVASLKVLYTESIPKLVNGLIAASVEIWSPIYSENMSRIGPIFEHNMNNYFVYSDIIEQLDQAYFVGFLRIFFWNQPTQSYGYQIEVSTNKRNWKTVANKSNERACSWQTVSFTPLPVVYIKIYCTGYNPYIMAHDVKIKIVEQQTG